MGNLSVSFFVLFSFLSTVPAFAAQKTLSDYWAELDYKFERLAKRFTNNQCHQTQKDFFACGQAVNAILQFNPKNLVLIPESYRVQHPELGDAVQSYGQFSFVKKSNPSYESEAQEIRETRKQRKEIQTSWENLYLSIGGTPSAETDFENLISIFKGQAFFKKYESRIVGAVTNTLYRNLHDPHTLVYPSGFRKVLFGQQEDKAVSGIGAAMQTLEKEGKKLLLVKETIADSPAEKAGLLPNDIVFSIDGIEIETLGLEKVPGKVLGKKGTEVTLVVLRDSQKVEIKITRDQIVEKNVTFSLVGDDKSVGYIRLLTFMEVDKDGNGLSCKRVKQAVDSLQKQHAKSLILDLRGNVGGLMDEAACISNLFLDLKLGEPIVSTKSHSKFVKNSVLPELLPEPVFTKLPMVVLIDAESASASEIVAGALQDYQRAFLVGEKSYGKGTAQTFRKLGVDSVLELKETTARFFLPSGRTNQIVTVEPDIEKYQVPNPTEDDKTARREEDFYAAIPPLESTPWKQPRLELMRAVQSCTKRTGTADSQFESNSQNNRLSDYQLLSAIDVAQCVEKEALWSINDPRPQFYAPEWIIEDNAKYMVDFFKQTWKSATQKVH